MRAELVVAPPAVQPDTAAAGYFTGSLAPTSASAVVVVPTFTCTGTQSDSLPLTTATSFAREMTSAMPIVQVHALAPASGRGTLIFKHVWIARSAVDGSAVGGGRVTRSW